MAQPSKLTPDQWETVAEWRLSGLTLKQIQERVESEWGISLSQVAISRHKQVKAATTLRDKERIVLARDIGSEAVPGLMQGITHILRDLTAERAKLRTKQDELVVGSRGYSDILKQIKVIDASLSSFNGQLMSIMKLNSDLMSGDGLEEGEERGGVLEEIREELRARSKKVESDPGLVDLTREGNAKFPKIPN